jgi:branched-chain amino acid transport system ATP-binding protein
LAASGLTIENVTVRYGDAVALVDASLELAPGARIGIVGRNGAGKSSLLKAVAGSVKPASGRILLDGVPITKSVAHQRVKRGITMVPEGRRIFPSLSVENNLRVGGFASPKAYKQRTAEILELFPVLGERRKQSAASLSGGEAQMLAIGQALMSGPKIVLLDEPSLGLAPIVVASVLDTMRKLSDRGIAILLVEQSVRLAQRFVDELHVIDSGRMQLVQKAGEELDEKALQVAYLGGQQN